MNYNYVNRGHIGQESLLKIKYLMASLIPGPIIKK